MKINVELFLSHFVGSSGSRAERIRQLIAVAKKHSGPKDLTPRTVDKWFERGVVPAARIIEFQELGLKIDRPVTLADFKD